MIKKLFLSFFILSLLSFSIYAGYADPSDPPPHFKESVEEIILLGDQYIERYTPETSLETLENFSELYFKYYEGKGIELAVLTLSSQMNKKTETFFTQIIGFASEGKDKKLLSAAWGDLKKQLTADLTLLETQLTHPFWEVFLQSLTILLREGFEALLIITALAAYLRREHAEKTYVIYYGMFFALLASILTAFFFNRFFKLTGAYREGFEGITMLIAAGVLFYVSYWLFAKREAAKWQHYIKQKMTKALSTGSMFALGSAAFLAVYREGAETILFYQALILGNKQQTSAIIFGFIAASGLLILIYRLMQMASFKIPYRLFFSITAIFLYYMAFYFIGSAIPELQEAGWLSISPISGFPSISWLGLFPTWQNIYAQLSFLIPTLGFFMFWTFRKRFLGNKHEIR